jgi:TetR/AcrR family transcriptional regulator, regulator of cefoperazone and chloramphenicol sensitivity
MGTSKDSERTRARVIAAAGELFADHGYHGVTVRDIIQKAKTHQSALNYHFAGKETLYRDVLLHACDTPESAKLELEALRRMPPRQALRELVRAWIRDYTTGGAGGWKARLVDRECHDPSPIFREIVAARVLPDVLLVAEILGQVVARPVASTEVQAAVLGLVGQVATLCLYRQLLDAVTDGLYDNIHRGDWLADALTESLISFVQAIPRGNVEP